jgi:hypothetical protein
MALGSGDISTILLAKGPTADAVLVDDHKARTSAAQHGAMPLGGVGILSAAFQAGLVSDLREVCIWIAACVRRARGQADRRSDAQEPRSKWIGVMSTDKRRDRLAADRFRAGVQGWGSCTWGISRMVVSG